jgi:branched-chain amino acid transport system substrate-binding protein
MKRKVFWFMAVSLFLIFAVTSFSYAGLAGDKIKIGVIVSKTGSEAEEGIIEDNAATMAAEEINAAGGIGGVPIKLYAYDTRSLPSESINSAKKLIYDDKVLIILGPASSSNVEVAFPVANRGKTVCVSPLSSKPGVSEAHRPWGFRNTITSDKLYRSLIERWAKDFNIKKVAIVYDAKEAFHHTDGTVVFPKALGQFGIPIVTTVTCTTGDIDFSAQLTKIDSMKPDGIILALFRTEAAQVVKQARRMGITTPFTGGLDLITPRFTELGGKDVEGIYGVHSLWVVGNPDPKMQRFIGKVEKRTGKIPSIGYVRMYDTVYMTKHIIEKMGVTNKPADLEKDREKIRNGWQNLKDYRGLEGRTSINEKGDGEKETYLLIVKDGAFQRLP